MKKRFLTIALLALAFGSLCYAKKAKKVDFDLEVQQEEQKAEQKKDKKSKKEKKNKNKKDKEKEQVLVAQEAPAPEPAAATSQEPAQETSAQAQAVPEAAAQEAPVQAAAPVQEQSQEAPAQAASPAPAPSSAPAVPAKQEKIQAQVKRIGGDVALQDGVVRMETVRASGSVLFYVVNGKKIYPALKTSEYGQSNYLSLFFGAKEYRLNKNGHCVYNYDVNSNSIKETLLVKGVAEVVAYYELAKYSPNDSQTNSVRVKVTVKNLQEKKSVLALKAVYNLCLGENRQAHYSTATNKAIGSEYLLVPSKEDGWIISSDGQNAIEFVIYGRGVTPPKKAVMANKDVIDLATPVTLFTPGNTFNSILSYNDSSLALFWDPVELDKDESAVYSYIINFSDSDFQNSGKEIVEDIQESPAQVEAVEAAAKPDAANKEGLKPSVDGIDPAKLNMEYVQQLINHINSLERSDPSLNKVKIQQLQTEVDEVLQVLRSGK